MGFRSLWVPGASSPGAPACIPMPFQQSLISLAERTLTTLRPIDENDCSELSVPSRAQ